MYKMKISIKLLLIILTVFFSITYSLPAAEYPLKLTDALKKEVRIEAAPERIISLAPNVTEILFAIGCGDNIVGVTEYCDYPAETKKIEKVGGFNDFSIEKIMILEPDLIVAIHGNPKDLLDNCRRLGKIVYSVNPQSIEGIFESIEVLCKITGHEKQSRKLLARMKDDLIEIEKAVKSEPAVKVYFGSLISPYYAVGPDNFIDSMITRAGGVNIASSAKQAYPVLSIESIMAENPDVIIAGLGGHPEGKKERATFIESLKQDSTWGYIKAVRNGKVYFPDPDLTTRPGPRVVEGLRLLAESFHPEAFKKN
jgi:cobalamin transport system substrate-binding protein